MLETDKYSVINIRRYLDGNPELGEEDMNQILSELSSPANSEVEHFLRENAVDFTKKSQSVTYLIFSVEDGELLRISELDELSKTYTMSAFLIAQLGKNFANRANKRITGGELLEAAWKKVEEMQYVGGGMVVFLEANNEEKLLSFYR